MADLSAGFCMCHVSIGAGCGVEILTFHCPGDRWPTVDMSKALSRICFLPFWLVSVLMSPIVSAVDVLGYYSHSNVAVI